MMTLEQAILAVEHMLPGGDWLPEAWLVVKHQALRGGGKRMNEFPKCPQCKTSILLPLSDYGGDSGGSVMYKAWVCAEQKCGWTVRIDKGQVAFTRSTQTK